MRKAATTTLSVVLLYFIIIFSIIVRTTNATWIDMDTPLDKRTTKSLVDGTTYDLVRNFNILDSCFCV